MKTTTITKLRLPQGSKNKINNSAPIITSSYYGMGFQYLNMIDNIDNPVHVLPVNKETQFIENNNFDNFYSINIKFKEYNSKLIQKYRLKDGEIRIYYNSKI